jgi:hypothetical protein
VIGDRIGDQTVPGRVPRSGSATIQNDEMRPVLDLDPDPGARLILTVAASPYLLDTWGRYRAGRPRPVELVDVSRPAERGRSAA